MGTELIPLFVLLGGAPFIVHRYNKLHKASLHNKEVAKQVKTINELVDIKLDILMKAKTYG